MGCCSQNQQLKTQITQQVRLFDFNIKQNAEFTIQMRAQREIWGATKDMIKNIESAYQGLMVQNAFFIKKTRAKIQGGGFKSKFAAPPLVDIYWQETILYSVKYQEFCTKLVGGIIDREEEIHYDTVNKKLLKNILPDYNYTNLKQDGDSFVWILQKDMQSIVQMIYKSIRMMVDDGQVQVIISEAILKQIDASIRIRLHKSVVGNQIQQEPGIYNIQQMKADLPKQLESTLKTKYCQSNTQAYINEYLIFMHLLQFSEFPLTPSEEVDQVWHTHQHCTANYRQFTLKYFGKFIHHNPTTGGSQSAQVFDDQYSKTLAFYEQRLKIVPPKNIWPSTKERFNPNNYIGFWVSTRRLIFAVIRVIEALLIKQVPTEEQIFNYIYASYQAWMGSDFLKKGEYTLKLNRIQQEQQHVQSQVAESYPEPIFWVAGGCGMYGGQQFSVASMHNDAGCNGGCNVGCGANDGGGCGGGGGNDGGDGGGDGGGAGCGGGNDGGGGGDGGGGVGGGGGCGGGGCGGGGCGGGGCGGGD